MVNEFFRDIVSDKIDLGRNNILEIRVKSVYPELQLEYVLQNNVSKIVLNKLTWKNLISQAENILKFGSEKFGFKQNIFEELSVMTLKRTRGTKNFEIQLCRNNRIEYIFKVTEFAKLIGKDVYQEEQNLSNKLQYQAMKLINFINKITKEFKEQKISSESSDDYFSKLSQTIDDTLATAKELAMMEFIKDDIISSYISAYKQSK